MPSVRKTGGRQELDAIWNLVNGLVYRQWSAEDAVAIGNGGTAGRLRTNATCHFRVDGAPYTKNSTDDLWNLSAEVDTDDDKYRAYWLYLDTSGTASFDAGEDQDTADKALASLPEVDIELSIIGVFVAGPETDFDDAGGLAAQGDIYDRVPNGVPNAKTVPNFTRLIAT